jgi:hypothetical protein
MAQVLKDGGFLREALVPMREAVETALRALLIWRGQPGDELPSLGLIDSALVKTGLMPDETLSQLARLREESSPAQAPDLFALSDRLFSTAVSVLESA